MHGPVRHQVAAGAFDHAGSDRESGGKVFVVVQIRGVIEQIVSTPIYVLPFVGLQLSSGGTASYPRGHQAGLAAQDAEQSLLDPRLAGGLGLLVEARRGLPHVLADMYEVEHDGELDTVPASQLVQDLQLGGVAVDQGDPALAV